ncbi:MAG: SAM-dependent methyltransferase, partial [Chromatiales bacterium]|nr:SAM-dependent methyltransferase [Chromatiales bacterium]
MIDQLDAEPLPRPSAEALAHSDRMRTRIRDAIAARGGAIRFAEFMDLALYAPGLGYYSAGATKFGAAG